MSRKKWFCLDCNVDTGKISEHYFLNTSLWMKLAGSNKGMLCVGCVEKRLGRRLIASDFTPCHLNDPKKNFMSDRPRSRLSVNH